MKSHSGLFLTLSAFIYLIYPVRFSSAAMTISKSELVNYGNCVSPDNMNGSCVQLEECQSIYNMVSGDGKNRDYLRRSQCGLDNTQEQLLKRVLVCCPDVVTTAITPATLTTMFDNLPLDPGNVLPNSSICGHTLTDKIVGGTVTQLDEFPWMVLLNYKKPFNKFNFHCGGALINTRYVVTAAHCVASPDMPNNWSLHSVRLGEWDTNTNPDCKSLRNGKQDCAPPHIDVLIEKKIVHELYAANSINQFDDIALLRLAESISYTHYIRPICVPAEEMVTNMFTGTPMDVAGWGATETLEPSVQKLKIMVNVWNLNECQDIYRSYQLQLNGKQLCAGGKEGIDTCKGDSGGPLMVLARDGNREVYFLAGIVSYGPKPCGLRGWPGVYTRVGYFVNWIQSHLEP